MRIRDDEPELYRLIAPLVMNPKVLKSNNNYPFKNFSGTVWYVAMEMVIFLGLQTNSEERNKI